MTTITLFRDDEKHLRFVGEVIAEASSRSHEGPTQSRWTELALYRTAGGKLVVARIRRTCWQGEEDQCAAEVCADPAGVVRWLMEDSDGRILDVHHRLITRAATEDPRFGDAAVEHVD